jgi:hypothetical protein
MVLKEQKINLFAGVALTSGGCGWWGPVRECLGLAGIPADKQEDFGLALQRKHADLFLEEDRTAHLKMVAESSARTLYMGKGHPLVAGNPLVSFWASSVWRRQSV